MNKRYPFTNDAVKGLPTPFDLTGDSRWDEDGDLLKLYDLELEKRVALSMVFTGVNPVFTPTLNTVKEDEMVNIIEFSGDEPDGVNVFSQISGGEGNIFEEPQEAPGNGHGNGEEVGVDEQTKAMVEEFAVLLNPKTTLTPHLWK